MASGEQLRCFQQLPSPVDVECAMLLSGMVLWQKTTAKKAMKVVALIFDTQSELPVRGVMHCMFSVFDSVTLYRPGRA